MKVAHFGRRLHRLCMYARIVFFGGSEVLGKGSAVDVGVGDVAQQAYTGGLRSGRRWSRLSKPPIGAANPTLAG